MSHTPDRAVPRQAFIHPQPKESSLSTAKWALTMEGYLHLCYELEITPRKIYVRWEENEIVLLDFLKPRGIAWQIQVTEKHLFDPNLQTWTSQSCSNDFPFVPDSSPCAPEPTWLHRPWDQLTNSFGTNGEILPDSYYFCRCHLTGEFPVVLEEEPAPAEPEPAPEPVSMPTPVVEVVAPAPPLAKPKTKSKDRVKRTKTQTFRSRFTQAYRILQEAESTSTTPPAVKPKTTIQSSTPSILPGSAKSKDKGRDGKNPTAPKLLPDTPFTGRMRTQHNTPTPIPEPRYIMGGFTPAIIARFQKAAQPSASSRRHSRKKAKAHKKALQKSAHCRAQKEQRKQSRRKKAQWLAHRQPQGPKNLHPRKKDTPTRTPADIRRLQIKKLFRIRNRFKHTLYSLRTKIDILLSYLQQSDTPPIRLEFAFYPDQSVSATLYGSSIFTLRVADIKHILGIEDIPLGWTPADVSFIEELAERLVQDINPTRSHTFSRSFPLSARVRKSAKQSQIKTETISPPNKTPATVKRHGNLAIHCGS